MWEGRGIILGMWERPRDSNQSTPTPLPHMGYFAIEERE